ncbi:ABC transporter ATP-binding protein [Paenibacillus sp. YAF4_2]|uniref:ABC transporter ATP-binding protein n=1 Tax=Paenibacillus sp. YAF4_2 TaxID=3233085 RepID=UPI003F9B9F37
MSLLQLNKVSKYKFDEEKAWLFRDIAADISAEDRIVLIGGSGQGKSTLLRIIALLEGMDDGEICLEGKTSKEWKPQSWRKKVSYVAQKPVMLTGSIENNLRTVSLLHDRPFEEELARRYMEAVGLGQLDWGKNAVDLSGGEQQRLALVRSLMLNPDILLLDEITSSLDPGSKHAVEQLLLEWVSEADSSKAYLWITHDVEQARAISNQVWFMAEGCLLEKGEATAFFEHPNTTQAKKFMSGLQTEVVKHP